MGMRFHAEEGLVKHLNRRSNTANFARICQTASRLMLLGLSLVVILGFCAANASAQASDVYITPDGNSTGNCASSPHPPAWFNSSGNWGSGSTQIGPGTTVHLCGTFNGGSNSNLLSVQGKGTSGHPITILFESGTVLQAPYFSYSGAINIDNKSFIIIDGGTNGLIQNTANGSSLGNKQSSVGVSAGTCNNCEIRNLTIANIYVHVVNETSIDQTMVQAIQMSGSNWLVHDNVIHDCGWCVRNFYNNGDTNVKVYNNDIYNADHGYIPAGSGGVSGSNFFFYNNHVHDYKNWDTAADSYHHDGVHAFGVAGANLTNLQIYDNLFDGNTGANFTSHIYIERPDSSPSETNPLIFNNIFDGSHEPGGNFGMLAIGSVAGAQAYNNTFIGVNNNASYCVLLAGGTSTLKNNVFTGCWAGVYFYSAAPNTVFNYNTYANQGSCGIGYSNSGTCFNTISSWRSFTGQDANAQLVASAGLDGTFHPMAGSAVIVKGTNLAILGIAGLQLDKAGVVRILSGAWDSGAYQSGTSVATLPDPPQGVTAIVQ
jgi:hypothetical protein